MNTIDKDAMSVIGSFLDHTDISVLCVSKTFKNDLNNHFQNIFKKKKHDIDFNITQMENDIHIDAYIDDEDYVINKNGDYLIEDGERLIADDLQQIEMDHFDYNRYEWADVLCDYYKFYGHIYQTTSPYFDVIHTIELIYETMLFPDL